MEEGEETNGLPTTHTIFRRERKGGRTEWRKGCRGGREERKKGRECIYMYLWLVGKCGKCVR